MNKRIVIENNFGKICCCVVDGNENLETELNKVYDFAPGGGYRVEFKGESIAIVDYFHGDTMATIKILSVEDTELPTQYHWVEC